MSFHMPCVSATGNTVGETADCNDTRKRSWKRRHWNGPQYSELQYNVNAFFDESLSASAKFYSRNTAKKKARSADTHKKKGAKDKHEETDGEANKDIGHLKGVAAYHDLRHAAKQPDNHCREKTLSNSCSLPVMSAQTLVCQLATKKLWQALACWTARSQTT